MHVYYTYYVISGRWGISTGYAPERGGPPCVRPPRDEGGCREPFQAETGAGRRGDHPSRRWGCH